MREKMYKMNILKVSDRLGHTMSNPAYICKHVY